MMLVEGSVRNYFTINFKLLTSNDIHFDLTQLENMLPWEKDIYIYQLIDLLKKKKERAEQNAAKLKAVRNKH